MEFNENSAEIRPLREGEIGRPLFAHFCRRQEVTLCLRKIEGAWRETPAPFAMGCTDAQEIDEEHARREPFDRQLECDV